MFKKEYIPIYLALILVLVIGCWRGCDRVQPTNNIEKLTHEIKTTQAKKDSVKVERVKADTARKKADKSFYKKKAQRLSDTTISRQCDSIIKIVYADCDTVKVADTTALSIRDTELKLAENIIQNQSAVIIELGLENHQLKRKESRRKLRMKAITVGALAVITTVLLVK